MILIILLDSPPFQKLQAHKMVDLINFRNIINTILELLYLASSFQYRENNSDATSFITRL